MRNRNTYFKQLITKQHANARVLNIASGPCRDMKEAFDEGRIDTAMTIDCIETDLQAIDYAKELLGQGASQCIFHHTNAFRFESDKKFDLIWSAGLFDYFEDDVFVKLLQRLRENLSPGGKMVIGNFSVDNPSRPYMEFLEWTLQHRTNEDLVSLAMHAGFNMEKVWVEKEELGINLFLHLGL